MKNNVFKSFRFEIILYSLLSLIYTMATEAGFFFGFCVIRGLFRAARPAAEGLAPGPTPPAAAGGLAEGASRFTEKAGRGGSLFFHRGQGFAVLLVLAVVVGIALFILYFLLLTKKFIYYLDEIGMEIQELSLGNFEARLDIRGEDEFAWIADRLNHMAADIQLLMENERKNDKSRNEMITSVAHDLRTPLTSIIGYLDLAGNKPDLDAGTREKYISIAYDKAIRLQKLIEDLFSYTKYSSGEVILNLRELDMVKFMEQMAEEFYPSFEEAGLGYEFTADCSSAVVNGDGDLLARAVTNLIGNAVKYGRDGKNIKLKLEKKKTQAVISVINFGEVIPAKDLESIFDRFYRVENSRSRETGGTGLGLAIAKKIILMHSGAISVKSDLDGTVFEVMLPLARESREINEKQDEIS